MDKIGTVDIVGTSKMLVFYALTSMYRYATVGRRERVSMYITKEELNRRLTKTDVSVVERERVVRGKEKRLTNEDRGFIGILSELDTQKNVAELTGVSQTTVSNVSRGLIAPSSGVNTDLKERVESGIEKVKNDKLEHNKKIEDLLLTNLSHALSQVTANLKNTDAPEASKIAVDMSKILNSVSGSGDKGGNRTAIIINVPSMKEEKSYQTLTV